MISIVIPIYNEEKALSENLFRFQELSKYAEIIFVDGDSKDRSVDIISGCGRIVSSQKGRAKQMNYGAGRSQGDILFFLHADNIVYPETLKAIENQIEKNGYIAGCLRQRINKEGIIFRLLEWQGNRRARSKKIFYGDQGIFVKKDVFEKIKGFPEVPIMEDVLFSKKLRQLGKTVILSDKILVSPRRWEQKGILRTVFIYTLIIILFWLKLPLEKIKHLYDDLR